MTRKIIVIGGGPAGMIAAGTASSRGQSVILLEKNEKLGKKLYITGKGRCNLTNASDPDTLLAHVNNNPSFLYSAFYSFGSDAVMDFFEENGVPLKIERGRRVFPKSEHASDITKALTLFLQKNKVDIRLGQQVRAITTDRDTLLGVQTTTGEMDADAVIVATGGLSYPSTGSTGDGYRWAKALGHSVTKLYPSLVSLMAEETWIPPLTGLSLKNVGISLLFEGGRKPVYQETGEMLFTHNGVSGPVVLSISSRVCNRMNERPKLLIDLKPALEADQLDERILRDFQAYANRDFINALDKLLPGKLIPVIATLSGIPPNRKVNAITRSERKILGTLIKNLTVTLIGTGGFDEAVITKGGVDVRGIDPSTMMSKYTKGLFFAGEVLDLDAMTGGYNLQIAFSTGYLAGMSV